MQGGPGQPTVVPLRLNKTDSPMTLRQPSILHE